MTHWIACKESCKVYDGLRMFPCNRLFWWVKHLSRLHRCWWRMLETKWLGDKFEMLVTDSGCWWPIEYIEKITNITTKVANIMILSPTSEISHHHNVTNITDLNFSSLPWLFSEVWIWMFYETSGHEQLENIQ